MEGEAGEIEEEGEGWSDPGVAGLPDASQGRRVQRLSTSSLTSWHDGQSRTNGRSSFTLASDGEDEAHVKVKVLGHGAFGTAVLYRRIEDRSLVVVKEFDLTRARGTVRQSAIRESEVLFQMHHPNIIQCFDTFESNGSLMIEMEYADGGTLRDLIVTRNSEPIPEPDIHWYLFQLLSALDYIHGLRILHRDLKTENVFMTQKGVLKLGDFGIAKELADTADFAETSCGTPQYMAPEVFRGEPYGEKCDMFATGCIVYELCALKRTFQGTNIGAIVSKITAVRYAHLETEQYSQPLRSLVHSLLSLQPDERPTAAEALATKALLETEVLQQRRAAITEAAAIHLRGRAARDAPSVSSDRGVFLTLSSTVHIWGGGQRHSIVGSLRDSRSGVEIAVGSAHFAALTLEKEVYTWSAGSSPSGVDGHSLGQLGHGMPTAYRKPKRVDYFNGTAVQTVACGRDFTIAVDEAGSVYSWGSDSYGSLGHGYDPGQEDPDFAPVCLDFFASIPIDTVSVAEYHVLALGRDRHVYAWGCGETGRLGLGDETDRNLPTRITDIPGHGVVKAVVAGYDCSLFIKDSGMVYATGSNEYNKLGLDAEGGVLAFARRGSMIEEGMESGEVNVTLKPKTVRGLNKRHILAADIGADHTAMLDVDGCVLSLGRNNHGQRGLGHTRPRRALNVVGGVLSGQTVCRLACGDSFTIVCTNRCQLYGWGNGRHHRLLINRPMAVPEPVELPLSLQDIPGISTCESRTALLTEEVVEAQQMDRLSSSGGGGGSGSAVDTRRRDLEGRSVFDDDGAASASDSDEDAIPEWLQRELDAEHIPNLGAGADAEVEIATSLDTAPTTDAERVPTWLRNELEEAEVIPAQPPRPPDAEIIAAWQGKAERLEARVAELESELAAARAENRELKARLSGHHREAVL